MRGPRRRARDARDGAARPAPAIVEHVDAIVLSRRSAFGLAAADGVMQRARRAQGRGFPTRGGPVPIVPTRGDLRPRQLAGGVRPGPDEGAPPSPAASRGGAFTTGQRRGRAGATVGKWRGARLRGARWPRFGVGARRRRRGRGARGRERGRRRRRATTADRSRARRRPRTRPPFPEPLPLRGGRAHDAGRRRHQRPPHQARVPPGRPERAPRHGAGASTRRTRATTATSRSRCATGPGRRALRPPAGRPPTAQ